MKILFFILLPIFLLGQGWDGFLGTKGFAPNQDDVSWNGLYSIEFDSASYLSLSTQAFRSSDSIGAINVWVRYAEIGNDEDIISFSDEGTTNYYLSVEKRSNERIRVYAYQAGSGGADTWNDVSSAETWYCYTITAVNDTTYDWFRNGSAGDANQVNGYWFKHVNGHPTIKTDNIVVGGKVDSDGAKLFFSGHIAQVSIYSTTFTETEHDAIYNSGTPIDETGRSGLVALWDFHEGSGTTTTDLVNGLILTFNGSPVWSTTVP